MKSAIEQLEAKAKAAKAASHRLAFLSTEVKNKTLHETPKRICVLSSAEVEINFAESPP